MLVALSRLVNKLTTSCSAASGGLPIMKVQSTGPTLSVVFVDYDNIYLSLKRKNEEAARRFAKDAGGWLRGIETGRLITATQGANLEGPRRIVLNRCYGNPSPRRNPSDNSTDMNSFPFVRHHFLRSGFEVVDCPPLTAQLKNSADIKMVMDVLDFLKHQTYFDEFVLLSGDADFTPVLHRLRAHARRTVVYANDHTATPYTAISDGEVRESDLISLLMDGRVVTGQDQPAQLLERDQPSTAQLEQVAGKIIAEVASTVQAANQPVPLEALADRAVRALGHDRTIGTNWAGAGSFRDLLSRRLPADLRLSDQAPYYVFSASRQLASEPAAREPRRIEARDPLRGTAPASDARLEPARMDASRLDVARQDHRMEAPRREAPRADAPRHDLRPEPRQDARLDTRADTRLDYRPEARHEPRLDQRQDPRHDPRQELRPEPRPELRPELRHEPRMEPRSDLRAEPPRAAPARPAPPYNPPSSPFGSFAAAPAQPTQPPAPRMSHYAPPVVAAPPPNVEAETTAQVLAKIHQACQVPPLSPAEYPVLFQAMSDEITVNNLNGGQTIQNIAHRAIQQGAQIHVDDIRFVLEVVSEPDPWFEQGASAILLANRFRNYAIAQCRRQQVDLSAKDIELIEMWFTGGNFTPPKEAAPARGEAPDAYRRAAPGGPLPQQQAYGQAPPTRQVPPKQDRSDRWWHETGQAPGDPQDDRDADDLPRIVRPRARG